MQPSQGAQSWTNIESGSPLIRVDHVSRVIDSCTHKTVVYVTHDPQLAMLATARIELFDGHIGSHSNADATVTIVRGKVLATVC